jgi:methyl-accepting chemotaxis protein
MIKNMSVKTKMKLLLSMMFIGYLVLGIIGSKTASNIAESDTMLYEKNTLAISEVGKLLADFKDVRIAYYQMKLGAMSFKEYESSANSFFTESFEVFNQDFKNTYTDNQDKKNHEELQKLIFDYKNAYETFIHLSKSGASSEQIDVHLKNVFAPAGKAVGDKVDQIVKDVNEKAQRTSETNSEAASTGNWIIISTFILLLSLSLIIGLIILNGITNSLNTIQSGLLSFFRFLNRETAKAETIQLDAQDEFGQMAKVINQNIVTIEQGLIADTKAVENAVSEAKKVQNGDFTARVNAQPNNPQLVQLKDALNNMMDVAQQKVGSDLNVLSDVLNRYAKQDFTARIPNAHGEVEVMTNKLGDEISTMLRSALSNGMDLQNDASSLKQAVESLSTASNQQAASLEETAAAMEEMTSNVQQNAQKANDMASMAAQTDASAKEGAELAQRTATAMTEIQVATNSINNAVAIIENIAFQTNILSLNAAVEAATAGDAGKGFAVVAQEVRNLANRSADAAKEIKAMAEQAATKSNEGMSIATELTRGFEVIAGKIEQTTMLVQDVSNASREQMQGIGQINTAVTQLDQMTQENAKIAAEADAIANATIDKASAMVADASSKNFVGKNEIQAQVNTHKSATHKPTTRPMAKPSAPLSARPASPAPKPSVKSSNDDVWESF